MADIGRELIIGWDIGGVQSKCSVVTHEAFPMEVRSVAFEIWKGPKKLDSVLQKLASEWSLNVTAMGVTMTAELSDCFSTKREGVRFVLAAFKRSFPRIPVWCLSVHGKWVGLDEALEKPDDFAATNWVAAGQEVARRVGDGIWMDVGSTTTDIIPFSGGIPCALGRNDPDRLHFGELVYTGTIRSNPNTIVRWAPFKGNWCRVADEYFTIMGDCYLALGEIEAGDYTVRPPDGGPVTPSGALRRLARLVCADQTMVPKEDLLLLARFLRESQIRVITEGLCQVCSRGGVKPVVVATGVGKFLAREAAGRVGIPIVEAEAVIPEGCERHFPACAAARGLLLSKGAGK
jgi:hypothetical protein